MDNILGKAIMINSKIPKNTTILLIISLVSFICPSSQPSNEKSDLELLQPADTVSFSLTTDKQKDIDESSSGLTEPDTPSFGKKEKEEEKEGEETFVEDSFQDSIDAFNAEYEKFQMIEFRKENLEEIESSIKILIEKINEVVEIDKKNNSIEENKKDHSNKEGKKEDEKEGSKEDEKEGEKEDEKEDKKEDGNDDKYVEYYEDYAREAENTLNHLKNGYYHELKSIIDKKIQDYENEKKASEKRATQNFNSRNLLGKRNYSEMTRHADSEYDSSYGYFLFETLQSLMDKQINLRRDYIFVNYNLKFSPKKEIITKTDTDLINDIKGKLKALYWDEEKFLLDIFDAIRFMKNACFEYGLNLIDSLFYKLEENFMRVVKNNFLNDSDIRKLIKSFDKIKGNIEKSDDFKKEKGEKKQIFLDKFEKNKMNLERFSKNLIHFSIDDYSTEQKIEFLRKIRNSIESIEDEDWDKNEEFLNFLFRKYIDDAQKEEDGDFKSDSDEKSEEIEDADSNIDNEV